MFEYLEEMYGDIEKIHIIEIKYDEFLYIRPVFNPFWVSDKTKLNIFLREMMGIAFLVAENDEL